MSILKETDVNLIFSFDPFISTNPDIFERERERQRQRERGRIMANLFNVQCVNPFIVGYAFQKFMVYMANVIMHYDICLLFEKKYILQMVYNWFLFKLFIVNRTEIKFFLFTDECVVSYLYHWRSYNSQIDMTTDRSDHHHHHQ